MKSSMRKVRLAHWNCLLLLSLLLSLTALSCSPLGQSDRKQQATTHVKPEANLPPKPKAVRILNVADHDAVIEQASEVIQNDANDADAYRQRAQAFWYKGEYKKAIADAGKAISLKPEDASAYFIRGNAFGDIGNYDRALQDYNQSLRLAPDKANVLHNRGGMYRKQKEYKKAIEDYNAAIRLEPQKASAYNNRGGVYQDMKEYDKAIEDYKSACRLAPDDHGPFTNLAWMLATCPKAEIRDGRKAVEYARKACELSNWEDVNDLENLAAAYAETGQYREAVKWQKKALEQPNRFTKEVLEQAHTRLNLYETGKPCRDDGFSGAIEKR